MGTINFFSLVVRRSFNDRRLILSILSGMLVATTLMSSAPMYLAALDQQGVRQMVDLTTKNKSENYLALDMFVPSMALSKERIFHSDELIQQAVNLHFSETTVGLNRYLKTDGFSFYRSSDSAIRDIEKGSVRSLEGYFHSFQDMKKEVDYIVGSPPTSDFQYHPDGPLLEVSLSADLAEKLSIEYGDVLLGLPYPDSRIKLGVRVSGIFEALDPYDPIWKDDIDRFLIPVIPKDEGSEVPDKWWEDQKYYLALFISEESMMNSIPLAYPGAMVEARWNQQINNLNLREWTRVEISSSVDGLDGLLTKQIPGFQLRSGIILMLKEFRTQSFFSSIPLLLLFAVIGSSLLYFVFMISSYLIPARESDISLIKTRGASRFAVFRQYGLEGLLLFLVSTIFAPILAFCLVSLSGILPYFHSISEGKLLPTTLSWTPFILSFGFGGLCFMAFLLPPILRTSGRIVTRRRYLGRPESVTFIQKYYLDFAFLFICSVLLYEIKARGQLSSGGLEKVSGINEALLFAPILLLFSVAILSFRIFPILVKFMTGESSSLILLMGTLSVIFLSSNICYDLLNDVDKLGFLLPAFVFLLLVIGLLACFKASNKSSKYISFIFILGASLIYGVYTPEGDVILFSLTKWVLAFTSLLTGIFFLLSSFKKYYPPWISLMLWNMSRNPLQYTWLVVLLVLSSGVAVLSAALGSTLDHSYRDKIAYDVGSDARIVLSSLGSVGRIHSLSSLSNFLGNLPGVQKFSKAKRGIGNIGQGADSFTFNYLAFETEKITLWGREDFSAQSTDIVFGDIPSEVTTPAIEIPIGAREIGINVRPDSNYPLVSLWLILRDANLKYKVITLGTPDPYKWSKNKAVIPDSLVEPIQLVSVQISEPGFGASGTPGKMFFDDLFAVLNSEEVILEDFEDYSEWVIIPTSSGSGDSISIEEEAAVTGRFGFSFEFGKEMNNGIRGLFWGTYGSYLPVVVSQTFVDNSGFGFGDYLFLDISQTLVIGKITGVVDFFPTLNPGTGGFLLADLDAVMYLSSLTNPHSMSSANEIFLELNESVDDTIAAISDEVGKGGQVHATKRLLEKLDNDPLISAGWKLMSSISITVALYIALLGYFIHMIFLSGQIKSRMGTLRSLGMTLSQSFRMIFVEQILLILLGVGLGTLTGVGMTRLMVSAITTTDNAVSLVPPALITIDFFSLLICAGTFFILFTFMVIWISFYFFRLNLGTLSRLED